MKKNESQGWNEDAHPAPTPEQWAKATAKVKADLAKRGKRIWPEGSKMVCPRCHAKTLEGRDDLALEIPSRGHVVIFRHLQGARCAKCAYQLLEPGDQHAVEEEVGVSFHSDYEAKVSRIGSGTLGTYWPKDVARAMHLEPQDVARIHVIAPDTAVVKFEKGRPGAA
jgi:hypothetical protein